VDNPPERQRPLVADMFPSRAGIDVNSTASSSRRPENLGPPRHGGHRPQGPRKPPTESSTLLQYRRISRELAYHTPRRSRFYIVAGIGMDQNPRRNSGHRKRMRPKPGCSTTPSNHGGFYSARRKKPRAQNERSLRVAGGTTPSKGVRHDRRSQLSAPGTAPSADAVSL